MGHASLSVSSTDLVSCVGLVAERWATKRNRWRHDDPTTTALLYVSASVYDAQQRKKQWKDDFEGTDCTCRRWVQHIVRVGDQLVGNQLIDTRNRETSHDWLGDQLADRLD